MNKNVASRTAGTASRLRSKVAGWLAIFALLASAPAAAADSPPVTFVACAPGYPGSTAEAQSAMDTLAAAVSDAAGWPRGRVAAVYHEAEKAGVARIGQPDAGVVMVPLAFYLEHGDALKLVPRMTAVQQDGQETEVWTLVAKRGAITGPQSLDGWQIISLAGFSPRFVKNVALAEWGKVPDGAKVTHGAQVLSALRKAAKGEKVAVLLDRIQAASLQTLPFAADLEVVTRSAPLPAGVVATVGERVSEGDWKVLSAALLGLGKSAGGAAALKGVRLQRFVPVDSTAVATAKKLFAGLGP